MLELIYITNKSNVAKIAENYGVDTICVDMEFIGKNKRQKTLNTVKNFHTVDDVSNLRENIKTSKLMVRVNPIHDKNCDYCSSYDEIKSVIDAGADAIMLPYFKTAHEVDYFLALLNGTCKPVLLFETVESIDNMNDILSIGGFEQIHIGINDLSLCYQKKFMFELFEDGTIDNICEVLSKFHVKFGIGGIAGIGQGLLPSEYVIKEHYRLGSSAAILSRSFCDTSKIDDLYKIENVFKNGISKIRQLEIECQNSTNEYFIKNKKLLDDKILVIKKELYN